MGSTPEFFTAPVSVIGVPITGASFTAATATRTSLISSLSPPTSSRSLILKAAMVPVEIFAFSGGTQVRLSPGLSVKGRSGPVRVWVPLFRTLPAAPNAVI